MSSINKSGVDFMRPGPVESFKISQYSRLSWKTLTALGQCATKLPYACSQIRTLLNNAPSIPPVSDVPDSAEGTVLLLEGYSKWSVSPQSTSMNRECDLNETKVSSTRSAHIGVSRPSTCVLSDEYLPQWPGFQSLPRSSGNYLALCILGWSYIFSVRLVELRRMTPNDNFVYTDNIAQWSTNDDLDSNDIFDLYFEKIELAEFRWWAALLAGGSGWHATLNRDGHVYHPPWECHLANNSFRLHPGMDLSKSSLHNLKPPSSAEAQTYLHNFAQSHDCFDQLIAAFTAAMTLPTNGRFGARITLPKPVHGTLKRSSRKTEAIYADRLPTINEIPHFMALSCITNFIASSLSGCFWEPGIPCNLASEWLNPALKDMLPFLIQQKNYHAVISALSYRRPRVASLWLGATISGLLPRMFQVCQSYLPPISLEAVVWTRSPQSFMDPEYHGRTTVTFDSVKNTEMISREDELRLLYLTDTHSEVYGSPPLSPYPPFGFVGFEDTSVEVRLHAKCGHELCYVSWVWERQNSEDLSDYGSRDSPEVFNPRALFPAFKWAFAGLAMLVCLVLFLLRESAGPYFVVSAISSLILSCSYGLLPWPRHKAPFDDSLSASATRNLFTWTFFSDGTRLEERRLWDHEWLNFLLDRDDDNVSLPSSSSSSVSGQVDGQEYGHVEKWLEGMQELPG